MRRGECLTLPYADFFAGVYCREKIIPPSRASKACEAGSIGKAGFSGKSDPPAAMPEGRGYDDGSDEWGLSVTFGRGKGLDF